MKPLAIVALALGFLLLLVKPDVPAQIYGEFVEFLWVQADESAAVAEAAGQGAIAPLIRLIPLIVAVGLLGGTGVVLWAKLRGQ